jgi:hypothetical protein
MVCTSYLLFLQLQRCAYYQDGSEDFHRKVYFWVIHSYRTVSCLSGWIGCGWHKGTIRREFSTIMVDLVGDITF